LLVNVQPIKQNQYVIVANGMKIQVNGMEEFNLFSKQIRDILYIKNFSINSLLIKKITQKLNYNVIFFLKNVMVISKSI